ncbi:sulfurtransferase TusA family protein [Oerskovia turbata]|uniref:Sulfurtransferase TusA family protein n=1 Tax=Oerskovia turbata TaxID=1713 RepID=A0A4Q1KRQ3_9CELL|nr:sulfurtransferase TusA family protein [Oerskovia turbata]RXR31664.1 sulfurtransferase TusA family protein [Oerskovia turbata]
MSDEPVTLVDARGLRCPLPVIRLAAAARDHVPGDVLTVWSTDPAARHDVPAWARMRGHAVVESTVVESTVVESTVVESTVVKGAEAQDADAADATDPGGSTPDGATTWAISVRLGG